MDEVHSSLMQQCTLALVLQNPSFSQLYCFANGLVLISPLPQALSHLERTKLPGLSSSTNAEAELCHQVPLAFQGEIVGVIPFLPPGS